jgi:predicted transcriptional regulator
MPCELVVFELLPTARGELAKELVKVHGYTQARVAVVFGVTSAAVSQYIKGLRGGNPYIDNSIYRDQFNKQIALSAERIANGADLTDELCDLCAFVKQIGMLDEIYAKQGSHVTLTKCAECPRDNFDPEKTGQSV